MQAQAEERQPDTPQRVIVARTKTTVKKAERSIRIWLEGKRLPRAGFEIGARFFLRQRQDELHLKLHAEGDRRIVSATRALKLNNFEVNRPVLKLDTEIIGRVFEVGEEIEVLFYDGLIVIKKPAKSSVNRLLQMRWVPEKKG